MDAGEKAKLKTLGAARAEVISTSICSNDVQIMVAVWKIALVMLQHLVVAVTTEWRCIVALHLLTKVQ